MFVQGSVCYRGDTLQVRYPGSLPLPVHLIFPNNNPHGCWQWLGHSYMYQVKKISFFFPTFFRTTTQSKKPIRTSNSPCIQIRWRYTVNKLTVYKNHALFATSQPNPYDLYFTPPICSAQWYMRDLITMLKIFYENVFSCVTSHISPNECSYYQFIRILSVDPYSTILESLNPNPPPPNIITWYWGSSQYLYDHMNFVYLEISCRGPSGSFEKYYIRCLP